jgi:tRNA-specific 2-thiouridylase
MASSSKKIAVAMSGGVDSSVAAALLVEKYGKENVFGLTMKLFCYGEATRGRNCCSLDAIEDARSVCKKLGMLHYVVDLEKEFKKEVIKDFISEYELGRTPNPCVRCNKLIKFNYLLKKAKSLGADLLATGHYARINEENSGYKLLKGVDIGKDQSYFLYDLDQAQLKQIIFPLGGLTKQQVRTEAEKMKLKTAKKIESQDICFIPETIEKFVEENANKKPGDIVDISGKVLGKHQGLAFYTIGQRKGLGGGFAEPVYVIGLDVVKNQVVVGRESELYKEFLSVQEISWVSGNQPDLPLKCTAKIRYQTEKTRCQVFGDKLDYKINFAKPQKAITPGQSVVFYQDEEIIGGGIIQ